MSIATLIDEAALRFGAKPAIVRGRASLSFAAFREKSHALAQRLVRETSPGDRILLFMENSIEFLLATHACERAGLIRVPINARLTSVELRHILAHCQPRFAFIDHTTRARFETALEGCETSPTIIDARAIQNQPRDDSGASLPSVPEFAIASISYTSGTTGKPKGVVLTHGNWLAVWKNMLVDRDIRERDRLGHVGPLTHASGAYAMPFWIRGATSVIIDHTSADDIVKGIQHHQITVLSCVPTMIARLLDCATIDRVDLSTLRKIFFGAETMPPMLLRRALLRFGAILEQNYGLTEAMMTCITESAASVAREDRPPGALGRPYSFVEIALRDADGVIVPDGEVGEITIRSPHVMQGYWNMPAETAEVLRDRWLWSGDLARREANGDITLVGRRKDIVISGGFNLYPSEIESVIADLPGIREVAVFGVTDEVWGERLVACVVAASEDDSAIDAEKLTAQCKPILGFKTPKSWVIRMEPLPRTAIGKVDKARLRAECVGAAVR